MFVKCNISNSLVKNVSNFRLNYLLVDEKFLVEFKVLLVFSLGSDGDCLLNI